MAEPKSIEIDGNRVVVFDDHREEIDGLEKLKTMNCDKIDDLLGDAYVCLHRTGHHLMAHALRDLVSPIVEDRERAEYSWVLASECPNDDSVTYVCLLSDHPEVNPKTEDLTDAFASESTEPRVLMKRIKKQ